MRKLILPIVLVLSILSISAAVQQPKPQQWEYKFEYAIKEKKANELGAQGWELVSVSSLGSGPASNVAEYVFKRAK